MASSALRLATLATSRGCIQPVLRGKASHLVIPVRTKVYTESGALLEKPVHVRFGLIKVALTVAPFITMGGLISREFAAWLEENELFVPDDDDDD